MKMASFWQYLTGQICADREKDKFNYRFPSIIKNNGKVKKA